MPLADVKMLRHLRQGDGLIVLCLQIEHHILDEGCPVILGYGLRNLKFTYLTVHKGADLKQTGLDKKLVPGRLFLISGNNVKNW